MKPRSETKTTTAEEEEEEEEELIPGLPEDVAELCLVRVPFPYQTLARSVSAAWNRALSRPSFRARARARSSSSSSSSSSPFLFVFAFHPASLRLQCQALDPLSRRWFLLPQIPLPSSPSSHGDGDGDGAPPPPPPHPASFAFASLPSRGELFVLAPRPAALLLAYRAATNSWTAAAAAAPGPFIAAGAVAGRILAASGDGAAARYDPGADRWEPAPGLRRGMARYDAAVVAGRRMYVTEGWAWPFDAAPRGAVFDADRDAWAEMPPGMREGWTGASAVAGDDDRLFVVAEYGDRRLKSYDPARDSWRGLAGPGVPPDLPRPFAVAGDRSGRIFVVGRGLDVAAATVLAPAAGAGAGEERVEWEVVKAPPSFADLAPCNAQILYL